MKVYFGFEALPHFTHPAVTVGSFDGVHLGHRAIVERLTEEARHTGGESIVLTFEPHPRITLGRAEGLCLLTTLEEKTAQLAALGVDHLIVIPFDRAFSALSGREFIERHLIGTIGAETLVAGYNHRFGHDRIDSRAVAALGLLRVVEVPERRIEGQHVSSTAIRRLMDAGDMAGAELLLGRRFNRFKKPDSRAEEGSDDAGPELRSRTDNDDQHGSPDFRAEVSSSDAAEPELRSRTGNDDQHGSPDSRAEVSAGAAGPELRSRTDNDDQHGSPDSRAEEGPDEKETKGK